MEEHCMKCNSKLIDGLCEVCVGIYYADNLRRLDCPICKGKETRRPVAARNFGKWWMARSKDRILKCDGCGFTGDNLAFEAEATRRMMASRSPIINMADIEEIPC